jgi:hypothetical protein
MLSQKKIMMGTEFLSGTAMELLLLCNKFIKCEEGGGGRALLKYHKPPME